MNGQQYPPHWPLPADYLARIDAALARLDDADECCQRCANMGLPVQAAQENAAHLRDFFMAARSQFFPNA